MLTNDKILAQRVAAFNRRTGARVGDFLKLKVPDARCQEYVRFSHDWEDSLQTSECGSFYLSESGFISFSGGLDRGIKREDLIETEEKKLGNIWFFDQGISGAARGVDFPIECRVFVPKPDADLSGVYSLRCPYYLTTRPSNPQWEYKHIITHKALSHTAFHTDQELFNWLKKNNLRLNEKNQIDWLVQI